MPQLHKNKEEFLILTALCCIGNDRFQMYCDIVCKLLLLQIYLKQNHVKDEAKCLDTLAHIIFLI